MSLAKIAVDISSGDHGASVTLPAAIKFAQNTPQVELVLVGDESIISPAIPEKLKNKIKVLHAPETVLMDDPPVIALRAKKRSSMRLAVDLVRSKEADICVSAGNTGALMAMSHTRLRTIKGIDRPAIMGSFPVSKGKEICLLDLGANVTASSENLFQFAILAHGLQANQLNPKPRIALLNVGHEDIKGTAVVKETAEKLHACDALNFIGYIEGNELFSDKADIVVCDGFVGNIMLKSCEGIVKTLYEKMLTGLKNRPIFSLTFKHILKKLMKDTFQDYSTDHRNGAIFVGLNGLVLKSHGNASENSFLKALELGLTVIKDFDCQKYESLVAKITSSEVCL